MVGSKPPRRARGRFAKTRIATDPATPAAISKSTPSIVATGNAPAQTGDSVVYYRPGSREAALQAAHDLDILGGASPLPASGALAEAAPPDADVIAVLGPGQG